MNHTPIMNAAPLRAATYCRFSSDGQRETSISDQQRECHKLARDQGWVVTANYADSAISGADNSRPQYLEMIRAAKAHAFDVLIIHALSRLNRDTAEQIRALRSLKHHGIRTVTCTGGYDSAAGSAKIVAMVTGLQDEMFNDALAANIMRGLEGQALAGRWCGGRVYGYRLRPLLDESRRDAYGRPEQIGTTLEIDEAEASVVREIFTRYAAGESCLAIAKHLNERGVSSPGSTWKRKVRRCRGWMASQIRGMVRNVRYTGAQRWRVSQFATDPDSHKIERRARPESEWVATHNEALRLVSDKLFARAQERTQSRSDPDKRLRSGGIPKYPLSGLLKCSHCGGNFVVHDTARYECSSTAKGGCCSARSVRRDALHAAIIVPINEQLLAPARVARMVKEMQTEAVRRLTAAQVEGTAAPKELQELDARIGRLRARLAGGDRDMEPDELQAAIARAEAKRRELAAVQPAATEMARVFALLPKAAAEYQQQIREGLNGSPAQAGKARLILREMVGPIELDQQADGSVWASYKIDPAVLIQAAGGTDGRGRGI